MVTLNNLQNKTVRMVSRKSQFVSDATAFILVEDKVGLIQLCMKNRATKRCDLLNNPDQYIGLKQLNEFVSSKFSIVYIDELYRFIKSEVPLKPDFYKTTHIKTKRRNG